MNKETMSGGNGATDAELKQWLGEVCPVVTGVLKLPRPMGKAAHQALEIISVGTALRWVDMLGIGKADEIRLMAQSVPDAAAKLSSQEGQQAIRSWETTHRVVPVLRALKGMVKTILAFWKAGGRPRRAVIRALATMSASHVVPDVAGFREELAATIGVCNSSSACLIEGYAASVVTNEVEKIESIDRLVSHTLPFGPWVRSFWICLKLKVQGLKRKSEMGTELSHSLWRLSLILREIAGTKGKETKDSRDSESVF